MKLLIASILVAISYAQTEEGGSKLGGPVSIAVGVALFFALIFACGCAFVCCTTKTSKSHGHGHGEHAPLLVEDTKMH